jgi:serine/threonine-protein kinase HipA
MTEIAVHVEIAGVPVRAGTLYAHRRRATESASFAYHSDYLTVDGSFSLDPELPLTGGTFQTRVGAALFGALTDCAPDRWGRTLIQRREIARAAAEGRTARAVSELDYLLGVRDDLRQGALRFRSGGAAGQDTPFLAVEGSGVPALTDLPELLSLATRAENDTADLGDLQRLVHVGSSLGGARPKAHVRTADGRVAIAKFPSAGHDTWNVMAWEKVALDLAASAGVAVPPSRLLRLAGRSVLVVDRFDRADDGARIGYASAMTMLEATDGDRRSYLEIAEVIESRSARPSVELEQLWRRMVLSILVGNTDDHLRNHGFLHERDDVWRLAPAFDLNPDPAPGVKHLSTAISDGEDTADCRVALGVAEHFRLSLPRARDVLAEIVVAASRWQQVAARHGLSRSEIASMAAAFSAADTVPA